MSKTKWNLFGAFKKKKKDDTIILFPDPKDVFTEPDMEVYFTPILTYNYKLEEKEYKIHILTSAGLICENNYLNSEYRFFGFNYINGKYKFMGNLNTFGNSQIKEIYSFLREDFDKNKDYYLEQKVSITDYVKLVKSLARKAGFFTESQSICIYIENFYSHEMIKYNYEKTKKLKHLFEITNSVLPNEKPYFFDSEETEKLLENFYSSLKEYFKARYDFKHAKPVCSADTFRFSNFTSLAVTFLNPEENIIYTFEYTKKLIFTKNL